MTAQALDKRRAPHRTVQRASRSRPHLLLKAPCLRPPGQTMPGQQPRCSSAQAPASSVRNLSTRSDVSCSAAEDWGSPGPLRPRDTGGGAGARAHLDPARAHPGPPATAPQNPVIPGPGHKPWVSGAAVYRPAPSGRDRKPDLRQPSQARCCLYFEWERCQLTGGVEEHRVRSPLTARSPWLWALPATGRHDGQQASGCGEIVHLSVRSTW